MANKVGEVVPTEAELQQLKVDALSVVERLQRFGVHLSAPERLSARKPRVDAEPVMMLVMELAESKGLNLEAFPIEDMRRDLDVYQRVRVLEEPLETALKLVADTRLQAGSEAWDTFLAYYTLLSTMADRDPELATRLKPATEFMARQRRKKSG